MAEQIRAAERKLDEYAQADTVEGDQVFVNFFSLSTFIDVA
jgi:hypothetical protein